mmetsp:Transcript_25871/g.85208  ORF Transcript_25871/g.85208 Transcript_25871/m.85208 type:complete len:81 (+) Transcript_25871:76-318(+)
MPSAWSQTQQFFHLLLAFAFIIVLSQVAGAVVAVLVAFVGMVVWMYRILDHDDQYYVETGKRVTDRDYGDVRSEAERRKL